MLTEERFMGASSPDVGVSVEKSSDFLIVSFNNTSEMSIESLAVVFHYSGSSTMTYNMAKTAFDVHSRSIGKGVITKFSNFIVVDYLKDGESTLTMTSDSYPCDNDFENAYLILAFLVSRLNRYDRRFIISER